MNRSDKARARAVKSGLAFLIWALLVESSQGLEPAGTTPRAAPPLTAQPDAIGLVAPSGLPTNGVFARFKADQQYYVATDEFLKGHYDVAIRSLEKVIESNPGLLGAWEVLGCSYWKSGRTNEARRLWEQLLKVDPKVARAHMLLGSLALAQTRYEDAEKEFRASLSLNPGDIQTSFALGLVLRAMHRGAEAGEIFGKILADDNDRHDARLQLALVMVDQGRYDEALKLWRELPAAARNSGASMLLTEADILMNTGSATGAIRCAQNVLASDRDNPAALQMLACISEYSAQSETAIPYLKRIVESSEDAWTRQHTRMRLAALYIRLNKAEPLRFSLNEAIVVTQDFLKETPGNPDAMMLLGDLWVSNLQLEQAERQYLKVLRDYNPRNRRAHGGLFQVYIAQHDYGKAREQLRAIESFNPQNPYLHYWRAQLAESQGDLQCANREARLLEAAGTQGAAAVIIYHGIVNSELSEIMPARLLREHLLVLKKAGFRFITARELPAYLADRRRSATNAPEFVAVITFDDARRDTFYYGTPVLREQGVTASMHVPVGDIERDNFLGSWELLNRYLADGAWVYGSHLMNASDLVPVDGAGATAYPLANRVWIGKEKRLETETEYRTRIAYEYRGSREIMERQFGQPVNFMAYPMGDIGQETRSDVPDAVAVNLAAAATNYAVGFIQTEFGYAVHGDNPLLYQRYEPDRSISADELLRHVMEYHPVFLARRMQTQYAAQAGKRQKAGELTEELKQTGYLPVLHEKLEKSVHEQLAGRSRPPDNIDQIRKGPYQLDLGKPYLAARADYFHDVYENVNYHLLGAAGMNLTPNVIAEAFGGIGQLKQETAAQALPPGAVKLNEQVLGLAPSVVFPFPMRLAGQLARRSFTGDAETSLMRYAAELETKPLLPLDLAAQFEHDAPPSARSVLKDTSYDMGALSANWNLFDWWDLNGGVQHYAYSDDNRCDHFRLGSKWLLWPQPGLYAGLNYQYSSAAEKSFDYWTPYKLNRFFVEAQLRGNYRRVYYNLQARFGIGKEGVRPGDDEAYRKTLADLQKAIGDARRNQWTNPTYQQLQKEYDDLLAQGAPSTDWEPVLGLSASTRFKLGEHWELNGEVSYDRVPNYNQLSVLGGIKYAF